VEDKRQQIYNEVNQAWRSLNIAEVRLTSEAEALKQTSESLRIKSLRHRQGLEKTSDLLDAQARADASKVAHIRATYDFMIAKAALLLASGTLTEEVVQ
jgi:outer membrane protein TolC